MKLLQSGISEENFSVLCEKSGRILLSRFIGDHSFAK